MKTIEQLSHNTFYSMEKYSQIVIDFVQDFEDIETKEELGSFSYQLDLVLEVIDNSRTDDVEVLKNLQLLVKDKNKELSKNFVVIDGFKYFYEYKNARHKIDFCLGTKNPKEYCNGYYLYSEKDAGDGVEFVIVSTDNPDFAFRS
jgi:hypothetical protein